MIASLKRSLLVTGSEGYVGKSLVTRLKEDFHLVTVDRLPAKSSPSRVHIRADLARSSDIEKIASQLSRFRAGVEALVHLSANASSLAPWEKLYRDNVVACIRTFELASRIGMRKVIFASSTATVSGYHRPGNPGQTWPLRIDAEDWPVNAYGVTKVLGEALLKALCSRTTIRGYALRIGTFWDGRRPLADLDPAARVLLLHGDDFAQIVRLCINDNAVACFAKFFCTSAIRRPVVDISETTRVLGYRPTHAADDHFQ